MLDSGAEGPGFKSQPRCCRVTVLSKLFTLIVPLFTKQQNWQQPSLSSTGTFLLVYNSSGISSTDKCVDVWTVRPKCRPVMYCQFAYMHHSATNVHIVFMNNSVGNQVKFICSKHTVADPGFLQGGCGSWCLWSAPSPFMPSLPPTLKKISWELAAR